jgi:hypothetical protein
MRFVLPRHLRAAARIAIFAILLNALAPAITSVQAALGRTTPAVLPLATGHDTAPSHTPAPPATGAHCGSPDAPSGVQAAPAQHDGAAPADAGHARPDASSHGHGGHAPANGAAHGLHRTGDCPFCHVHAGSFGLPAPPPASATHARLADPPSVEFVRVTQHILPRQHAFSRGPPASV